MDIENTNYNKFTFIYRVATTLSIIKNMESCYKQEKDTDKEHLKRMIDKYNCLELEIKEIGFDKHIYFNYLKDFYDEVKETGFFESYVAYESYTKEHLQGINQENIYNEYDDFFFDLRFNKKTLEEIISEAVYHDAKACELIYQCTMKLKGIYKARLYKLTDAMWEKYIHTINLSKSLLQAGIAENLVEQSTGILEIERKIYDFKEGDVGTPMIDVNFIES